MGGNLSALPSPKEYLSGGGGGNMEKRVANLEKDVGEIKVDIAGIKAKIDAHFPNFATKADIAKMETSLIKWIVGTMLATAGLTATIAFGFARLLK